LGGRETTQEGESTCCSGIWWGVAKETRKKRVPVARAFVEEREKPGGRGYLCPGDFGGGVAKETRRDRVPVARACVGVGKRNQEGEGTCGPGILVGG